MSDLVTEIPSLLLGTTNEGTSVQQTRESPRDREQ